MGSERARLKPLTVRDGKEIYDMLQNIGSNENEFRNEVKGMTFGEYKEWLRKQYAVSKGIGIPKGYVRQWTYWLYIDDRPIGYGKIRECVTEESKRKGGNIGCAIDSRQRRKGYGGVLFEELLREAKRLGIKEIYSTVEKNNGPSIIIHEKHGFKLLKDDGERYHFSSYISI